MYLRAIFTRSLRNLKISLSAATPQARGFDQMVLNDLICLTDVIFYNRPAVRVQNF